MLLGFYFITEVLIETGLKAPSFATRMLLGYVGARSGAEPPCPLLPKFYLASIYEGLSPQMQKQEQHNSFVNQEISCIKLCKESRSSRAFMLERRFFTKQPLSVDERLNQGHLKLVTKVLS